MFAIASLLGQVDKRKQQLKSLTVCFLNQSAYVKNSGIFVAHIFPTPRDFHLECEPARPLIRACSQLVPLEEAGSGGNAQVARVGDSGTRGVLCNRKRAWKVWMILGSPNTTPNPAQKVSRKMILNQAGVIFPSVRG